MALHSIRLELARSPDAPEGNPRCGYELVAPLDEGGRLDIAEWRASRRRCTVRRFWEGEGDEVGRLIRTARGVWAFSYAPGEDDDEPIFHIETHVLLPGDYVSVTEHDGQTRTFRVAALAPAGGS